MARVVDTNVAFELMRPAPADAVSVWIACRNAKELYLAAVSEAEVLYGVAIVPAGRRRNARDATMHRWLDTGFSERFLPFGSGAARACADIAAGRCSAGRPIASADCQIAAIARSRGMVVVTRNVRDVGDIGIEVVGPWTAA